MKTQITTQKGTQTVMLEMSPPNWAGTHFKKYQEVVMNSLPANTIILTKRGTVGVKASMYPETVRKLPSRLRVSSARGTKMITL